MSLLLFAVGVAALLFVSREFRKRAHTSETCAVCGNAREACTCSDPAPIVTV